MARHASNLAAEATGPRGDICVHLTIANTVGSVEHYFHFLLGFFIPLVRHLAGSALDRRIGEVLVRSCGPMDSHLLALGDPRIVILDKSAHDAARGLATTERQRFKLIRGYDKPFRFDRAVFVWVRDLMLARSDVQDEIAKAPAEWQSKRERILLIRRGPPDPFYLSRKAEVPGAGTSRRSIPNQDKLRRALADRFGDVVDTALEGLSLSRQIALFHLADIVVAQHGAAFANLVWARRSTRVVEIFPRTLIADYHPESGVPQIGASSQDASFVGLAGRCACRGRRRFVVRRRCPPPAGMAAGALDRAVEDQLPGDACRRHGNTTGACRAERDVRARASSLRRSFSDVGARHEKSAALHHLRQRR